MPFSCPSVGPFHALSVGSTLGPLCGKERAPMQGRTQRSSLHVCHLRRSHYQTSPEISRLDLVCHLYSPCIACTSQPMFLDGAPPFASLSLLLVEPKFPLGQESSTVSIAFTPITLIGSYVQLVSRDVLFAVCCNPLSFLSLCIAPDALVTHSPVENSTRC